MPFTDENRKTIDRLDSMLRDSGSFERVPLTVQGYKAWYALLLGSLTTLIGDDELVLGHVDYDESTDIARLIVFTTHLVVLVDVEGAQGEDAEVSSRAVSRRTIRSLDVRVSDRHDADKWGRSAQAWPGTISFTVEYPTLPEPLRFSALSFDRYRHEIEAPAVKLLAGLRKELASSTQS